MMHYTCQECQTSYSFGAIFCDECGSNLLAQSRASMKKEAELYVQAHFEDEQPTEPGSLASQIEFVILNTGRRIKLPLTKEIHIGRLDPNRETRPNLDLSDDGGAVLGVSRAHACLQSTDNGVILVDLGSTNGTFVRDICLDGEKQCKLDSGDIFRLGDMQVQVFFEH